ncbi:hypothetical protein [Ruminococcus sp.]|uniref:hypothetical protein n=1 Tax=Ruminococcus sp. TaxID=41978 RepID=UPI0025EA2D6F|nr:hypothetical protein [Ruminococcus sp.]MBQ8966935.1 hypothetical protein [Ruminococcus sp.]
MKTLRDLIAVCDRDKLIRCYFKICKDIPAERHEDVGVMLSLFIDALLAVEPKKTDDKLLLCYTSFLHADRTLYPMTEVYSLSDIKEKFRFCEYLDKYNDTELGVYSHEEIVFKVSPDVTDELLPVSDLNSVYSVTDYERELAVHIFSEDDIYDIRDKYLGTREPDYLQGIHSYPIYHDEGDTVPFCDWAEILGYLVPEYLFYPDNAAITAAGVLDVLTYFGYILEEYNEHIDIRYEFGRTKGTETEYGPYASDEDIQIKSTVLTDISRYRALRSVFMELEYADEILYGTQLMLEIGSW